MRDKSWLILWVIAALMVGGAVVAASACLAPGKHEELWFEAGKAGIQLSIVTLIGALLAAGLRYLDTLRDERRKLLDARRDILRQIIAAYNDVKSVRRTLRAYGFRSSAGTLTEAQVQEFRAQMKILNAAQLALESVGRDLSAADQTFEASAAIITSVREVEQYVGDVIENWENSSALVRSGADAVAVTKLAALQSFLAGSKHGFEAGAARHIDYVEARIRAELRDASDDTDAETKRTKS
jgi:hypothetical protein